MAANAGAIRAGRAFVEAFLDDKKLVRGLKSLQKRLVSFGSTIGTIGASIAGLGTAAAAPLLASVKIFADAGSALSDMSARTGVSVEALGELGYAAQQSGASTEAVEKGLRGMSKTMLDAANGGKGTLALLKSLGLSFDDLKEMSPDAQFIAFGDAISKIENPTKRAAVAMDVFGKSGAELLPLFADGAEGVYQLRKQAHELGLVMSSEDAAAADELGDQLDTLWGQFRRIWELVGASLTPVLSDFADTAIMVTTDVIHWIDANRELVVTAAAVTAAVIAGGVAVAGLGAAFVALGAVVGAAVTILGAVTAAIGFLMSPIGLVSAAVVAFGAYFLSSTGIVQESVDALGSTFDELADIAGDSFGAIKTALAAGQYQAAANVLMAALRLAFEIGTNAIEQLWKKFLDKLNVEFQNTFGPIMDELWELGLIEGNFKAEKHNFDQAGVDDTGIDKARKDLADAITEAKKFENDPRGRLGPLGDIIDAGGGVADLKAKATTAGTFSSEASRQFAQGADSELEELRAIRRNTKKIADKRGQVFE